MAEAAESPYSTESFGYSTYVARTGKGQECVSLELWLDQWAGADASRYSLCLSAKKPDVIREIASKAIGKLRNPRYLSDSDYEWEGKRGARLKIPLKPSSFSIPFVEVYADLGEYFFTVYFRQPISNDIPCSEATFKLLRDNGTILLDLAMALGSSGQEDSEGELTALEGGKKLSKHMISERSAKHAKAAKIRDGYRCQVCCFSFADQYGRLGLQFAEAHHMEYLSRLTKAKEIPLDALVTVCSNCHRMLHKMNNGSQDIAELRKIVMSTRKKSAKYQTH